MSKKVLFCIPQYSAFLNPVTNALKDLGYDVKTFDYTKGTVFARTLGFISNLVQSEKFNISERTKKDIQNKLISICKKWTPDYLLVIKGETITQGTLEVINKLGIITINWYPDWLVLWDWVKDYAVYYQWFFATCEDLFKKVKEFHPQTFYLPYASAPDPQKSTAKKIYNIVFIGQYTKRREKYFQTLIDLGLNIWGYTDWKYSKLQKNIKPYVPPQKTLDIFRQSKIVVNIQTGDDDFYPKAINNRTFEALGVGTFLLVLDYPTLYKHFNVKNSMVTFKSPQDLYDKAKHYLSNTKEREKIALSGWNEVSKHHTYTQRLSKLFKYIDR